MTKNTASSFVVLLTVAPEVVETSSALKLINNFPRTNKYLLQVTNRQLSEQNYLITTQHCYLFDKKKIFLLINSSPFFQSMYICIFITNYITQSL